VIEGNASPSAVMGTLSIILPAGWYYALSVTFSGATQAIESVYETTL
jgi:hypothetical protein